MSVLLTEQIRYNVNGVKGMLDHLRTFAATIGWTVDYYETSKDWGIGGFVAGSEDFLQLHSDGWINQNMIYRFDTDDRAISGEALMRWSAIDPTERTLDTGVSTQPYDQNDWSTYSYYYTVSMPSSTFDTLWMYGNKYFIACVLKVTSTSVITFAFGSIELFPSWQYYSNGLFFFWPVHYLQSSYNTWGNMNQEARKGEWYNLQGMTNGSINEVYYEGAGRSATYSCRSFYANGGTLVGSAAGNFNKMQRLLNYNTYTDKRVAFNPTYFIRNPSTLVWYPLGRHPVAFVNGRNLTIGEEILFGTQKYRAFPNVISTNEIWTAFLIEE